MSEIQTFHFNNHKVRNIVIDGQVWWVGKDVCDILGLSNITWMTKRLDKDEFSLTKLAGLQGRNQNTIIINESGLYSVILRSDKPNAKPFRKWVTSEVLPSIRKTGVYTVDDKQKNVTPLKRGYNIIGNENLTNIFQSTAYDNNFINIVYEIAAYWKGVSDFSRGRLAAKIETSLEQCRKRPE